MRCDFWFRNSHKIFLIEGNRSFFYDKTKKWEKACSQLLWQNHKHRRQQKLPLLLQPLKHHWKISPTTISGRVLILDLLLLYMLLIKITSMSCLERSFVTLLLNVIWGLDGITEEFPNVPLKKLNNYFERILNSVDIFSHYYYNNDIVDLCQLIEKLILCLLFNN